MKKLSNTEADLKESVAYKKSVYIQLSYVFRLSVSYYYAFFKVNASVEVLPQLFSSSHTKRFYFMICELKNLVNKD